MIQRRISISLDTLPDKTPRVILCDNGQAHEDTIAACYDNAISLICEKRSAAANIEGAASQELRQSSASFSKNGIGCGTALKHLVSWLQPMKDHT